MSNKKPDFGAMNKVQKNNIYGSQNNNKKFSNTTIIRKQQRTSGNKRGM